MAGMSPSGGGRRRAAMSEINVTPMVDVMLVLLIIFMVTAPLIQQGVDVNRPKSQSEGLTSDEERLVGAMKRNGTVFVERADVALPDLESKMRTIFEARGNKEVFLRADTKIAYGKVAKALSALRRAGATRVGMVTEPEV